MYALPVRDFCLQMCSGDQDRLPCEHVKYRIVHFFVNVVSTQFSLAVSCEPFKYCAREIQICLATKTAGAAMQLLLVWMPLLGGRAICLCSSCMVKGTYLN